MKNIIENYLQELFDKSRGTSLGLKIVRSEIETTNSQIRNTINSKCNFGDNYKKEMMCKDLVFINLTKPLVNKLNARKAECKGNEFCEKTIENNIYVMKMRVLQKMSRFKRKSKNDKTS
jgi:hypothetical protein